MTPHDLRIFCTALGFTAVIMKDGMVSKNNSAVRAKALADLIEEFCHFSIPNIYEEKNVEGR